MTVRGRNFTSDSVVVVAGVLITDVSIQDTQTLTLVAPAFPSGLTTVTVQNRGGIAQTSLFVEPFPFDQLPVGHITTVAGGTTFTGDGFNAMAAFLSTPAGIALDSDGNLFISDEGNSRVRRVDATTGIVTTVAGSGVRGCADNGVLATAGALSFPAGLVVDASGNFLIADRDCDIIYKVDATTGVMTWLAGGGGVFEGFFGDGDPATQATLSDPFILALDGAGNLFFSDRGHNVIRRVDATTGIITTVAGNRLFGPTGDGGLARETALDLPRGIALDRDDNLFIAETLSHRIRRVDATTGIITTVAGIRGESGFTEDGGLAAEAAIEFPLAVVFDGSGNLLFSDATERIRKVDASTGILTTVAGTGEFRFSGDGGPATEAAIAQPLELLVDGVGDLLVSDTFNNRIRKVDATTGIIKTVAGTGERGFLGDGGRATEAALRDPRGLLVDGDGNMLISDSGNSRVRKVDATTGIITTAAGTGKVGLSGDGGPATEAAVGTAGIALDSNGNLFIVHTLANRIRRVDATTGIITTVAGSGPRGLGTGSFSGDGEPATEATLNLPVAVAVDGAGNLFISDSSNHRIRGVDATTGIITTVAGTGLQGFSGDGSPATEARLLFPDGVALDGAGNLFLADRRNDRIRRLDATTDIIETVAGTGQEGFSGDGGLAAEANLWEPKGVAVDVEGNLFIVDRSNGRIRRVDAATGIITTVAGSGKLGFTGDGGPALEADFFEPWAVAMDEAGNLLITDNGNKRIRVVRGIAPPGASPGIGPGPPGPDAKEPNNSAAEATSVLCDDSLADVSIRPLGDIDFYAVSLSAGEILSVDIDAKELGSSLDPVLGIFNTDGTTLLDSSDDDPAPGESSSLDSYLQLVAPAEGTYFIAVSAFSDLDLNGTDGKSTGSYFISFQCQAGPIS